MIGKIFYWLGLIEMDGPIEFIDNDKSVLPVFQKVIVD